MTGFETPIAECIEGSLVVEILGEVHEDEDFADTGMNYEDGSLVTSKVKGHNGIVLIRIHVLRLQSVDVVGETRDDRVLENLDGWNVGDVERRFAISLETDNIDGSTTKLKEIVHSRDIRNIQVEDVSVDMRERLLALTHRNDKGGSAGLAKQLFSTGNMLGELTLFELSNKTRARELSECSLLHLVEGDRDNVLGRKCDHLDRNIAYHMMSGSQLCRCILAIQVKRWRVEDDETFGLLSRGTVRCSGSGTAANLLE
jgi:hypothetical protein